MHHNVSSIATHGTKLSMNLWTYVVNDEQMKLSFGWFIGYLQGLKFEPMLGSSSLGWVYEPFTKSPKKKIEN